MSPKSAVFFGCLLLAGCVSAEDEDTMSVMARTLEKCGQLSELGTCLRLRAIRLLDRALRAGPIQINDYMSLAPDGRPRAAGRALSENEIEASLPQDRQAKDEALDEMITDKLTDFMKSRSIKLKILSEEDQDTGSREARKRDKGNKKDKGGMMMIMGMYGAMMVKLVMGKLALLAGKALIISKMALLLAAILSLKKLVGGGGGESHQVVYATAGHEGGGHSDWGRSDHRLAYSAHARNL